jgi:hypothetical protein
VNPYRRFLRQSIRNGRHESHEGLKKKKRNKRHLASAIHARCGSVRKGRRSTARGRAPSTDLKCYDEQSSVQHESDRRNHEQCVQTAGKTMRYQPPSRRDDDETRCIAKERAGRLPRSLKYEAQRDALEISALLEKYPPYWRGTTCSIHPMTASIRRRPRCSALERSHSSRLTGGALWSVVTRLTRGS